MQAIHRFITLKNILLLLFVHCGLALESKTLVTSVLKNEYNGFSKNWAIDMDDKGMVFCGNEAGLLTFDGLKWDLFKVPGNLSVRAVLVKGDRIYTGSFEQFGYWEKSAMGSLQYHSLSDTILRKDIHNDMIWKIIPSPEGGVIFQSFNTLFHYDGEQIVRQEIGFGIIFMMKVKDKLIAQKTRGNLVEYTHGKFAEIKGSEVLNQSFVRVFLPYGDHEYLIGSGTKGLFIWNPDEGFREWNCEAQKEIKNFNINSGYFDGQKYYIGTLDDGVFVLNKEGEIITHLNMEEGLEGNTILGIKSDKKGRVWLALNKGIAIVEFDFPIHFVTSRSSNLGIVHAAEVYNNKLYLGTNQGVYVYEGPLFHDNMIDLSGFKPVDKLKGQIWSLKSDGNSLLCGHNNGTYQISGDQVTMIANLGGGQGFVPYKLNNQNYLLQNTYTSLVLFKETKNKNYQLDNVLKGFFEPSRHLEVDQQNKIWISHVRRKEIFKVTVEDKNQPLLKNSYGLQKGLPHDFGNRVCKFEDRIVFSTQEGLYTYDELRDTIVKYEKIHHQLDEFAYSNGIVKTDYNKYWFSLPSKAAMFEVNSGELKKLFEYSFNDPYRSLDEKYPLIKPINDSITIFGLENGFAFFNEHAYQRIQQSPDSIYFKNIIYWRQSTPHTIAKYKQDEPFYIPYKKNKILFEFMSMASVSKGIRYEYKLEGVDKDWRLANKQNRKTYTHLPWGEYVFMVKGVDVYGNNLIPLKQVFIVEKPFFAKAWFLIIVVMALIGVSILLYLAIVKYIKRQKELLLEEKNKEWQIKHEEQERHNHEVMIELKNEMLQKEIQHQSTELANRTIATIKRKEVLNEVKEEILKQREHLKYSYPEKYMNRLIRMIDHSIEDEDDWKVFRSHFDHAHEDFFKRLKKSFEDLTPKDLRLCAYLKMNLSTKEIAPLMNVSPRSVEVHRYKIRKKLHLDPNDNLTEFMISF